MKLDLNMNVLTKLFHHKNDTIDERRVKIADAFQKLNSDYAWEIVESDQEVKNDGYPYTFNLLNIIDGKVEIIEECEIANVQPIMLKLASYFILRNHAYAKLSNAPKPIDFGVIGYYVNIPQLTSAP